VVDKKKARRRKRKAKSGTSEASSDLSSGRDTITVELTNVRANVTCDKLRSYVASRPTAVDLVDVKDASSESFETKRFWLKFKEEDYATVMEPSFWPPKIYFSIRRYFGRPNEQGRNNGSAK
jgi:hypothetical protein